MAANVYEGMFLLDSNRYGRDTEGVSGQITDIIQNAGGEILVSRLWEERRLAYQIDGYRKGTYWLTYFRLGGDKLPGIERQCQLSESIIRVLLLKVDPRVVDTLVGHATADTAAASDQDAEKAADKKEAAPDTAAETKAVAVAQKEATDPSTADSPGKP